jgi:hypothetical protein
LPSAINELESADTHIRSIIDNILMAITVNKDGVIR